MIQFKRGKTSSWYSQKTPLAEGQPGYDKDKHKLKIGDGKSSWSELPSVSGLSADEILSAEVDAKSRRKTLLDILLNPIAALLKKESPAVITYGTEAPDKDTVGQLYLQYYDAAPEVDYIVESGINDIWKYHKWKSGKYECCGTLKVDTTIKEALGSLYSDNKVMQSKSYPIKFKSAPTEVASLQSQSGIVWLAGRKQNTATQTAEYSLISTSKQTSVASYKINLYVVGY